MREVAALAGVSVKTVSRVVNGEPNVSLEVRERVDAAVSELDYRPNLAASNLRRSGSRTGLIGALLQDLSNAFSSSLLRAIEDAAREHRTGVLATSHDEDAAREVELLQDLVTRRVDGLVLMPASERHDELTAELHADTPMVFVDRAPRGVVADSVTVDNVIGGRLATEHLLAGGHRRIAALFHLEGLATVQDRLAGFTQAHASIGLEPDPRLIVKGLVREEDATQAVHALLDLEDPPTAIFAARNILAVGSLRALAERGARHSVALLSFDDFATADLLDPPLTVIRQDVIHIGRTVAEMLFDRIGGYTGPPRNIVLEPTLVVRGSGEIVPPAR